MHSPERSLVAGVQEEQEISNLSQSTSDCPGLDTHRGNDELCQKGEIMCWPTMWPLQDLYCHKVGLDIAAEEATPAFSDQITPTRKLEEEIEILNPQELASESCGCPGYDCHFTDRDDECSDGQIRRWSKIPWHDRLYCHVC